MWYLLREVLEKVGVVGISFNFFGCDIITSSRSDCDLRRLGFENKFPILLVSRLLHMFACIAAAINV